MHIFFSSRAFFFKGFKGFTSFKCDLTVSLLSWDFLSCHVTSGHVTPGHVTSGHVTFGRVTWLPIMCLLVTWLHIMWLLVGKNREPICSLYIYTCAFAIYLHNCWLTFCASASSTSFICTLYWGPHIPCSVMKNKHKRVLVKKLGCTKLCWKSSNELRSFTFFKEIEFLKRGFYPIYHPL